MGVNLSKKHVIQRSSALEDTYSPLMEYVHDNVIGDGVVFNGPYGKRAVVYCDYTASGRPLRCIEDYISKYVYQYYANTHTTTCITAQQTTQFRNDAKMMIKRAVNASSDDVVIFTGSGTTGAIHKLIGVLELKQKAKNTVVFVSPFEHHSNLLPWKECGAEVIRIDENKKGTIDMVCLERNLKEYQQQGKRMIASFSAASNVTGIMLDTVALAVLCHKYGALSFWDYATAAPYLEIDVNASETGYKDAVFVSPHKFVGGPGSPGILIAKKSLFTNAVPHNAGGGTVLFVTKGQHMYVGDIESREEGGTPAIIESIRAGLCFQLKQNIGPKSIEERENVLYRQAKAVWTPIDNMVILGSGAVQRLPIFSFIIRYNEDNTKYLHHNFIAILLNDLFGIQARGGCACAGPYAEGLLGINGADFTVFLEGDAAVTPTATGKEKGEMEKVVKLVQRFDRLSKRLSEGRQTDNSDGKKSTNDGGDCISEDCNGNADPKNVSTDSAATTSPRHLEIMKPGFVRLNLPYFMNSMELKYIIDAVEMLCEHGWKLLPLYKFDARSGEWSHRQHCNTIMNLRDVTFSDKMEAVQHPKSLKVRSMNQKYFDNCLKVAQNIFAHAAQMCEAVDVSSDKKMEHILPKDKGDFCWFVEPWEAAADLHNSKNGDSVEKRKSGGKKLFNPRQMSVFSHRSSSRRTVTSFSARSKSSRTTAMDVIEEEGNAAGSEAE